MSSFTTILNQTETAGFSLIEYSASIEGVRKKKAIKIREVVPDRQPHSHLITTTSLVTVSPHKSAIFALFAALRYYHFWWILYSDVADKG